MIALVRQFDGPGPRGVGAGVGFVSRPMCVTVQSEDMIEVYCGVYLR